MNFLLHRQLARRELGLIDRHLGPLGGVGAMLPDLWRMADRRLRAREGVELSEEPARGLQRGVDHHLEADRWFHATEAFRRGERETCHALLTLGVPKLGRFGHIAWELCLDGAAVEAGFDARLAELRADLAQIGEGQLVALAKYHGAETLDAERQARFQRRMRRIVEGLERGSWLVGYLSGAGLSRRVEGIRASLGLGELEEEARTGLGRILEGRLEAARGALAPLMRERREHLEGQRAAQAETGLRRCEDESTRPERDAGAEGEVR